jgi:CHAT domain-containing protein
MPEFDRDRRIRNLKAAIAAYSDALHYVDPERDPDKHAEIQRDLSDAYIQLSKIENRISNIQEAVHCCERALAFLDENNDGYWYPLIQANLGFAYREMATQDRASNLHHAIECYKRALRFWTSETNPHAYSVTQTHMGACYSDLPVGDRTANLTRALKCYHEAANWLTRENDPYNYASTFNSMGLTYSELPTGDPGENVRKAISCYLKALEAHIEETDPPGYATIQNNLGNSYSDTGDIEKAITCFKEALRYRTPDALPLDYATSQHNLGNAYLNRAEGDRAENLRSAITCYEEALRFRDPATVPTRYARTQASLGQAYLQLAAYDVSNSQRGIERLREAASHLPAETEPVNHASHQKTIGDFYFKERQWAEAEDAYASAIGARDFLYQTTATEFGRQAELGQAGHLVTDDAYCLARLRMPDKAVVRLETGRTRALAQALALDQAVLDRAKRRDRQAFIAARQRVKELEAYERAKDDDGHGDEPGPWMLELSDSITAARAELRQVRDQIRRYAPTFLSEDVDYTEIALAATAKRPVVYLLTTTNGSLALIVTANASPRPEHLVWLDSFTSDDLDNLLKNRNDQGEVTGGLLAGQVDGNMHSLQSALEQTIPALREHLVGPLSERLRKLTFTEATLIPVGRLGLLPLPAASDEVTLALAPSARVLRAAQAASRRAQDLPAKLFAVGNPLPPPKGADSLEFAGAEADMAGAMFGSGSVVLRDTEVTRQDVLSPEHLANATHLHFACHGSFNGTQPLNSALYLSGQDKITLRDLLDDKLDLSKIRLTLLSACQSGISEFERIPDETIGLHAGFLQSGVAGVVSTLWPVNDASTLMLIAEFYRLFLTDWLDPAAALRRAQAYLRDRFSNSDLADWFESVYEASGGTDSRSFQMALDCRADPTYRPFAKPIYWAGFVFTGA